MTEEQRLQEVEAIKQWLKDHDYIVIKYTCGEYQDDATTWCWYIEERQIRKERLKTLESFKK